MDWWAHVVTEELELDPQPTGGCVYRFDPADEPTSDSVRDGVRWVYSGRAHFPCSQRPALPPAGSVPQPPDLGARAWLDPLGRTWTVASFEHGIPWAPNPGARPLPWHHRTVVNPDGTETIAIAPDDVPTGPIVKGFLTFVYVGQLSVQRGPLLTGRGGWQRACHGGKSKTLREELVGTSMVDDLGRMWEGVSLDADAYCRGHLSPAGCVRGLDIRPPETPVVCGMVQFH
jgi:hypothetical protein